MSAIKNTLKKFFGPQWRPLIYRVKGISTSWRWKRQVGYGTYVDKTAHILRWRSVTVGDGSSIGAGVVINVNDYKSKSPTVVIGDYCWVGVRNFLSPGALISIGDYCMTGPDCKFLGTDHIFSNPFLPYISTGTLTGGSLRLGVNCWLGANVTVMGSVSIGHGSVVGAGSIVLKDVPPFSLVVGSPGRVIKRYDAVAKEWVSASSYTVCQEQDLPDENNYLKILKNIHPHIEMPWRAAGKSMGNTY